MIHRGSRLLNVSVGVILTALLIIGCDADESRSDVTLRPYDFSYRAYAGLLASHVRDGMVDYAALKENRSTLDSLVQDIALADLTQTTTDQQLAFYCNAYNIITIRSIVDAYPVASIKDIDGVWKKRKWTVAGDDITLDAIEHEILRPRFNEPRIHVAINCASIGCPPLLETPYYPEKLDSLLMLSSMRFARSPAHNVIDPAAGEAKLSAIFDWFGEDFIEQYYAADRFPKVGKKQNAALNFVISHLPDDTAASVADRIKKIQYLEYDWSLNDLKR